MVDVTGRIGVPPGPVRVGGALRCLDPRLLGARRRLDPCLLAPGDPGLLARVVANLVDNAVRYATSTVEVGTRSSDGRAVLVVADDGPGVAAPDSERMFDRFTRLDGGRSRGAGGVGPGLAIVREILLAHEGSIRVEDASPGTRMIVTLPASGAHPAQG
ncbi:MAG: hypothetical protein JWQ99_2335 [Blastococcus sp.]|nr:hypothetical protein [Blastococcus sp.]